MAMTSAFEQIVKMWTNLSTKLYIRPTFKVTIPGARDLLQLLAGKYAGHRRAVLIGTLHNMTTVLHLNDTVTETPSVILGPRIKPNVQNRQKEQPR